MVVVCATWQVRIFKTKAALFKKFILAFVLYVVMFWIALWLLPALASGAFDGWSFILSEFTTLVLLAVSLVSALKPPQFM